MLTQTFTNCMKLISWNLDSAFPFYRWCRIVGILQLAEVNVEGRGFVKHFGERVPGQDYHECSPFNFVRNGKDLQYHIFNSIYISLVLAKHTWDTGRQFVLFSRFLALWTSPLNTGTGGEIYHQQSTLDKISASQLNSYCWKACLYPSSRLLWHNKCLKAQLQACLILRSLQICNGQYVT